VESREIVSTALGLLRAHYVFPDRAEQAAAAVEAKMAAGDYDGLDEDTLASRLTADLYEVCGDKHLKVRPGGGQARPSATPAGPPNGQDHGEPADHEERVLTIRRRGRLDNFGIHRVERLPGNVGYLDIRRVPEPEFAGPAISAAMELVAGSYALIIDLRRNGGGSPAGVVFWCSHLLRDSKTHLNDIFDADSGETRQFWSLGHLQAPRYLDRPVYLLASERTFSGGEDFAYTLQALGRAVVIGETTGGGAHPTRGYPVSDTIHIGIPHARSINPVTGTNWEGTGVTPDVAVPQEQARDVAYRRALQHVLTIDAPPPITEEARDALDALPADPPA
jgi:Peptidase family S41/N-terminal domain of Peptidase_S41 in eukaryotic IRBP